MLLQVRRGLAGPDPARPAARAAGAPAVLLLRYRPAKARHPTRVCSTLPLLPACTSSRTAPTPRLPTPALPERQLYSRRDALFTCPCRTHLEPSLATHFSFCVPCTMSTHKRHICPCLALPCMPARGPGPLAGTPFYLIPCPAARGSHFISPDLSCSMQHVIQFPYCCSQVDFEGLETAEKPGSPKCNRRTRRLVLRLTWMCKWLGLIGCFCPLLHLSALPPRATCSLRVWYYRVLIRQRQRPMGRAPLAAGMS